MPFLICSNCGKKFLSVYHDISGITKLCNLCVKQSKCVCKKYKKKYLSELCDRHYNCPKDQREKAYWYREEEHKIIYSVSQVWGYNKDKRFVLLTKEVCSLKKAAIKCLLDNHVRVENQEEEYFYKKVIPNYASVWELYIDTK